MIFFDNITKKFPNGTIALQDVSFQIDPGEFCFIVGPSGAGKTTILRLLLREITPSQGTITVNGQDIAKIKKNNLPVYRRGIGASFQDFKLIEDRTVKENVSIVSEMIHSNQEMIDKQVNDILEMVKLPDKAEVFPQQLSGGELQRIAIARALATNPKIIFADEPTGNLDQSTGWEIMNILLEINKLGTTILVATHNQEFLQALKYRVIELEGGRIINDSKRIDRDKKTDKRKAEKITEKNDKNLQKAELKAVKPEKK
jgi:cell division transport system ATP-binding protein